jgi:hypothetical protein
LVATASLIVVLRLRKKPDGFLHCQVMNHQSFSLQVLYYTPRKFPGRLILGWVGSCAEEGIKKQ